MERLELKAAITVTDEGAIEAIAWPFGSADLTGDVIEKTADIDGDLPLPMLWHHDGAQTIGVWDHVEVTERGIEAKGRLLINDVARAREVRALIIEKAATGVSIGFVNRKSSVRRGGGRNLQSLTLREISVTPTPAHPGARVINLKADASATSKDTMENETTVAAPDNAAFEAAIAAVEKKAMDRLDKVLAKLNRPAVITDQKSDETVERKAFESFARRGVERMNTDEVKALTVSNDTAGGYLAPEQFLAEIEKNLVLYSPIRQVAKVAATSAGEILLPKRTGTMTAKWVGETATRTGSQPSYGQQKFDIYEIAAFTDISNRLLEDAAFNMEGELASNFAEEFGRLESAAFINGDGVEKPNGILANTEIETVETAAASISADDLIDLYHSLPAFYAANAVFAMNRKTIGDVRKLKDADGRFLWTDSLVAGNPSTILGRPVIEFADMPDQAAGAIPVIFGDFSNFRIFDRVGLSILRDPYTMQTEGQVRFHGRRRVGGAVSKAEAFKFLSNQA
ncbi:phage major capsid protein [Fulvimarina sp. 2208YS6-2-32]|uniref:Phage major capsid protein n=1 Tax=Fulvimarina uroteuthidis TaxID=3098149 RepID=A0ABU5I6Z7_9HYPH|nr:phage major capsid protein [Fulvimarina sp. 2208YS6-2-32]MDY8111154.1 phage major capsid protein [Fulvimarina sp. 2208YS6-2-32]